MLTLTRECQDQVTSTLDLVLSNNEHCVSELVVIDSLEKGDHCMVEFLNIATYYTVAVEDHILKYLDDFGDYQEIMLSCWKLIGPRSLIHFL